MSRPLRLFASSPKGIEPLLADELRGLGADRVAARAAGVSFVGPLRLAYAVCLWSRLASRVIVQLARFRAETPEQLYAGAREIEWETHLAPEQTLAVSCHTTQSRVTHSHYAALKVKDAVVDRFREGYGARPSVELERPDLRIHVYLFRDEAQVGLDLAGESLHRRGYRREAGPAPLKENLASAILILAGWPALSARGAPLIDGMCGSGTFPIEAAWMAGDVAPGLARDYFGFLGWRRHRRPLWRELRDEALGRREAGLRRLPPILGLDHDARAIEVARANLARAGLAGKVGLEVRGFTEARPLGNRPGLVVVNPPYGERMGRQAELPALYRDIGRALRERFAGWQAAVLTSSPALARRIGLPPEREETLYNGALAARLLHFRLADHGPGHSESAVASPGAEMLANRLRKNLRHLGRWARREGVSCYRVYDRDLPEYALAVDLYAAEALWARIEEYAPPATIDPAMARLRLREAVEVVGEVLEVPEERRVLRVRERQRGTSQYRRETGTGELHEVQEGGLRLLVNLRDYLDTGLFLDHRPTRAMLRGLAAGRRFLNLFAYTGTASVYAAAGGASETTSIDLSRRYLEWARANLELNGYAGERHRLVRADCLEWLSGCDPADCYGLIFVDPPTFSNSKRMEASFDVQREHVGLIRAAMRQLREDGTLVFSTNRRGFRLDREALADLAVTDITAATIAQDFARHPKVHRCWRVEWRAGPAEGCRGGRDPTTSTR